MIFNRVLPPPHVGLPDSPPPPKKNGENLQEALSYYMVDIMVLTGM